MKRNRLVALIIVAVLLVSAATTTFILRQRVRRHRLRPPATLPATDARIPEGTIPPVERWSAAFREGDAEDVVALLERIEKREPALYRKWSLAYLHARLLIDLDRGSEAEEKLEPFLAKGHPLRDRALYHRAQAAEGAQSSRDRNLLIDEYPDSMYRTDAIEEEADALAEEGDVAKLVAFAERVAPKVPTGVRRSLAARVVETLVDEGRIDDAFPRGIALLKAGVGDDAGDRTVRALDRPEVIRRLDVKGLTLFADAFQAHRHYDRAIALSQAALGHAWSDDLQFALGRSYFGNEQFAEAERAYLRGASTTKKPETQAVFYWHAARAAQLRGDDATAERLMTSAISVKGNFDATRAALTQRIRLRLAKNRPAEAASDLALLRKISAGKRAVLEGSLAYAVGMLAKGNAGAALATLDAIPRSLTDPYDRAEIAYWRARALEGRNDRAALAAYLDVLRSPAPTHFAYFARRRLDSPQMTARLRGELSARETEAARLVAEKKYDLARRVETDRILLSSTARTAELERLTAIYRELPSYRAVLELSPEALPAFPNVDPADTPSLLIAMGLADEATQAIEERWPLRPARSALTRSFALNQGGASRPSIYAIEVMMKSVPEDFHPDLLPGLVRQLLYPRYFYAFIAEDAEKYGADPALLLAIMREESRFDPRARSQAAARGLLQFIITTARDIGAAVGLVDLSPADLYDPRIIIRLGAKYLSELAEELDGNRYRIAAAYNAGPKQTALWSRMQAAPGDDYFLTAVNFDETKHYVRKVMNSYERYGEIYAKQPPAGGLRVEP